MSQSCLYSREVRSSCSTPPGPASSAISCGLQKISRVIFLLDRFVFLLVLIRILTDVIIAIILSNFVQDTIIIAIINIIVTIDESSDQDNLTSINDSKDSGKNSDDGADDSDVTEQCQEEDSGSVFTAVEAYDSSSAEDIGPYWNTLECTPYYEPIE